MKKEFINKHEKLFTILVLAIFTFALGLLSPSCIFNNTFVDVDSAVFKYIGKTISQGAIPYLHTFDHKGPLLYLINYIGYIINEGFGIWILEMITLFVALLFSYKTIRLFYSRKVAFPTLILSYSLIVLFFNRGNLTEEYSLPFLAISIYYFVKYLKDNNIKNINILVCGICFGLIAMLRPNNAFPIIGFVLFIIFKSIKEKDFKGLFNNILFFTIGLLIAILPFIIYFAYNHALQDFFEAYILFNFRYSSSSILAKVESLMWFSARAVLYLVLITFLFIFANRNKINNKLKDVCCAFALAQIFALLAIIMPGNIYGHYGLILLPALVFPICSFVDWVLKLKKNDIYLYIILYLVISQIIMPSLSLYVAAVVDVHNRSDFSHDELIKLIKKNTNEDDLIQVCGDNNRIYLDSKRNSASYFSFQVSAIMSDEKSKKRFYDEILKAKIIVFLGDSGDVKLLDYIKKNGYTQINKQYNFVYIKNNN